MKFSYSYHSHRPHISVSSYCVSLPLWLINLKISGASLKPGFLFTMLQHFCIAAFTVWAHSWVVKLKSVPYSSFLLTLPKHLVLTVVFVWIKFSSCHPLNYGSFHKSQILSPIRFWDLTFACISKSLKILGTTTTKIHNYMLFISPSNPMKELTFRHYIQAAVPSSISLLLKSSNLFIFLGFFYPHRLYLWLLLKLLKYMWPPFLTNLLCHPCIGSLNQVFHQYQINTVLFLFSLFPHFYFSFCSQQVLPFSELPIYWITV